MSLNVVVVNDNPGSLNSLRYCCSLEGIQPEFIECPQAALDYFQVNHADIVICELDGMGAHSVDFLTRVMDLHPHIYRILISSSDIQSQDICTAYNNRIVEQLFEKSDDFTDVANFLRSFYQNEVDSVV